MTSSLKNVSKKIVTKAITTRNVKLESVQFYYEAPKRDFEIRKKGK